MNSSEVVLQTRNQLYTDYDFSKVFIGKNTFENMTLANDSGGDLTYPIGKVLGRIAVGGKVQPLVAAATDGSQFPVGVLATTITILDGEEATVSVCVSGEVDSSLLVFNGAETLSTVVSSKQLRDRIASDTLGIKLITATEMTAVDNS